MAPIEVQSSWEQNCKEKYSAWAAARKGCGFIGNRFVGALKEAMFDDGRRFGSGSALKSDAQVTARNGKLTWAQAEELAPELGKFNADCPFCGDAKDHFTIWRHDDRFAGYNCFKCNSKGCVRNNGKAEPISPQRRAEIERELEDQKENAKQPTGVERTCAALEYMA